MSAKVCSNFMTCCLIIVWTRHAAPLTITRTLFSVVATYRSNFRLESENRTEHGQRIVPQPMPHGPGVDCLARNSIRSGEILVLTLQDGSSQV
jgi:hypothetical protein